MKKLVFILILFISFSSFSQQKETKRATMSTESVYMRAVGPLIGKKLIPEEPRTGEINPKRKGANKIVPGKGLPKGPDPLKEKQKNTRNIRTGRVPSLLFEATSTDRAPSDPTGAIGPQHYVSARNSTFAIHDRNGNVLVPSTSLANIFPEETLGDPVVFYDSFADRFVITQFSNSPNGILIAIGQGPDPVNDGWYTYRFNTGQFPDYPKFSIWSDGYYVTTNKLNSDPTRDEVVYALEREKMLVGNTTAKMIGFPLPGVVRNGFYSTTGFNAIGNTLPPEGDARILFFQDDAWAGVDEDALKLWSINVDWINPLSSSISEAEVLNVSNGDISPFDSTFDGASFSNIPQPGDLGDDIDVLQGAVMYATNYRRFCDYNAVVLNFAVDIDDRLDSDNISAIRWYELRQNGDGQPWTVYQEGTYTSPRGKSAWCGSMAMDIFGNIALGYTTMGTTENQAIENSFVSIRYTGRLAEDPLGIMTISEQNIIIGTDIQRNGGVRYGDYAQITVDPLDQSTFWHIAEYFENIGDNARNIVGVFKIAPDQPNDVGVISIDTPNDATFTTAEEITITLQNYGTNTQSNIPVSYTINGGAPINEIYTGSIAAGATDSFTFSTTANLTAERSYTIEARTNATADQEPQNDCVSRSVLNLFPNDVGIIDLIAPISGGGLTATESITIIINNYGGTAQSDIPVFYSLNGEPRVEEVFNGMIEIGETAEFTFSQTADLLEFGTYTLELGTNLGSDQNASNDSIIRQVKHIICNPTSNCSAFGDGLTSFELSNISNTSIPCDTGFDDFSNLVINLDRSLGVYPLIVRTGFANGDAERLSLWIDLNDNNNFEDSELLIDNQVLKKQSIDLFLSLSIPSDSPLGTHTLRVRAGDIVNNEGADLNNPCESMSYGTTHDYTVIIGENTSSTTDIIIFSQPTDQYLISMSDSNAPDELNLSIFSVTGQMIASNIIAKDPNGRFIYSLDMSYASSGIYFARFGNTKGSKSAKFIVP